jgi:hypothetical protein
MELFSWQKEHSESKYVFVIAWVLCPCTYYDISIRSYSCWMWSYRNEACSQARFALKLLRELFRKWLSTYLHSTCSSFLISNVNYNIAYVRRQTNRVAHNLARTFYFSLAPVFIIFIHMVASLLLYWMKWNEFILFKKKNYSLGPFYKRHFIF